MGAMGREEGGGRASSPGQQTRGRCELDPHKRSTEGEARRALSALLARPHSAKVGCRCAPCDGLWGGCTDTAALSCLTAAVHTAAVHA
eukprot:360270-Chlamydomonas_euryale.AAC.1